MPLPCPLWTWERRVTEVSSGHRAVPLLYAPTPRSKRGRGKHLLCLAAVRTLSSTSMGTPRNRWNFFLLGLVLGLTRQRGERRKPTCGKRVRSKFGFGSKVSKRPSASATKKFCNTKCTVLCAHWRIRRYHGVWLVAIPTGESKLFVSPNFFGKTTMPRSYFRFSNFRTRDCLLGPRPPCPLRHLGMAGGQDKVFIYLNVSYLWKVGTGPILNYHTAGSPPCTYATAHSCSCSCGLGS